MKTCKKLWFEVWYRGQKISSPGPNVLGDGAPMYVDRKLIQVPPGNNILKNLSQRKSNVSSPFNMMVTIFPLLATKFH